MTQIERNNWGIRRCGCENGRYTHGIRKADWWNLRRPRDGTGKGEGVDCQGCLFSVSLSLRLGLAVRLFFCNLVSYVSFPFVNWAKPEVSKGRGRRVQPLCGNPFIAKLSTSPQAAHGFMCFEGIAAVLVVWFVWKKFSSLSALCVHKLHFFLLLEVLSAGSWFRSRLCFLVIFFSFGTFSPFGALGHVAC